MWNECMYMKDIAPELQPRTSRPQISGTNLDLVKHRLWYERNNLQAWERHASGSLSGNLLTRVEKRGTVHMV